MTWGLLGNEVAGETSLLPLNVCEFPVPWYSPNCCYQLAGAMRWSLENQTHSGSCKLIWVLFESYIQSCTDNCPLTLVLLPVGLELFFEDITFFREILGSWPNRGEGTEVSCTHSPALSPSTASPPVCHPSGEHIC